MSDKRKKSGVVALSTLEAKAGKEQLVKKEQLNIWGYRKWEGKVWGEVWRMESRALNTRRDMSSLEKRVCKSGWRQICTQWAGTEGDWESCHDLSIKWEASYSLRIRMAGIEYATQHSTEVLEHIEWFRKFKPNTQNVHCIYQMQMRYGHLKPMQVRYDNLKPKYF